MEIENVRLLSIRPGDALVVSGVGRADMAAVGHIATTLKSFCRENLNIEDVPVLYLGELDVQVLRAEK